MHVAVRFLHSYAFIVICTHTHTHTHAHPVLCTFTVAVNQCDPPAEIVNGNITFQDSDPANILPGDMIEYACSEGTELEGPQYRFCQRTGNWSDTEPQCIGTCISTKFNYIVASTH